MNMNTYDVITIGSGAAGMIASIVAAKANKKVLLLEKLPKLGAKLKATGGGKCNLSNTLGNVDFMNSFGRQGRFMTEALDLFDANSLISFLSEIGVNTHSPDGFRIFPTTHNSSTILVALESELMKQNIEIMCDTKVEKLLFDNSEVVGVFTNQGTFESSNIIVATGGLGFPTLGANGDGYEFATSGGHQVTDLYPAMLPLLTKETWVASCKADTIAKVQMRINLPKAKKLKAQGDLIFTSKGIRGPVVLDFSREITPYLEKYDEVPVLLNLINGKNEEDIFNHIKEEIKKDKNATVIQNLAALLPSSVATELCLQCNANPESTFNKLEGSIRTALLKILASTPLTVIGHIGFNKAMITRGGVSLKEINPKTMQSKLIHGLYFCGEVMDLDGPCGGYNLQWSFSSGNLAGHLLS
ncbi:NAD(P)/FAD-dependent oxidoreductase [Arcobacter sp. HD9-500m-PIT-SAG03]|nr:NAD(P)/FAD-dependent oxidoreductase [Arcobacter sp. HD9-500m-PIT-SAG03]